MSRSLSITPGRKPLAPLLAFILLLQGAVFLQNNVGTRQVLLLIVGAALGLSWTAVILAGIGAVATTFAFALWRSRTPVADHTLR